MSKSQQQQNWCQKGGMDNLIVLLIILAANRLLARVESLIEKIESFLK